MVACLCRHQEGGRGCEDAACPNPQLVTSLGELGHTSIRLLYSMAVCCSAVQCALIVSEKCSVQTPPYSTVSTVLVSSVQCLAVCCLLHSVVSKL